MRGYITYILPLIVLFIFGFGIYDKFLQTKEDFLCITQMNHVTKP